MAITRQMVYARLAMENLEMTRPRTSGSRGETTRSEHIRGERPAGLRVAGR